MTINVLGIDLAKRIFQLHGTDRRGRKVLGRKVSRKKLMEFVSQLKPCLIGMEACSSAHFWAREFKKFGHDVKLISPQYVKPYVKTNKNDAADAEAIAEAATRPNMRFVPIKEVYHQDIQAWHRVRARVVRSKTALINECHGLLSEYGVVISKNHLVRELTKLIDPADKKLTAIMKEAIGMLYEEYKMLHDKVLRCDRKIRQLSKDDPVCKRLQTIPGVGELIASAIRCSVADHTIFKNGREFSASLGLVPRHFSSGGKTVLGRISKRGDSYLRCLLVHGSRAALRTAKLKNDRLSQWVLKKEITRGKNKAIVALANKNARTIWALMNSGENYKATAA